MSNEMFHVDGEEWRKHLAHILVFDRRTVCCRVSDDDRNVRHGMATAIRENGYEDSFERRILYVKVET